MAVQLSLSNEITSMIIHIHVRTRAKVTVTEMKKEFQATLLQSSASRAPVAAAFNLFIL